MEHPGGCRDHFAHAGADPAERAARLERLGLFFNGNPCAAPFGLPETEALKGLTLYPAQLAGVADRLGSIEAGKEATLLTSDGSILDARTKVTHLWVAGKEVSLENRHTRLYEKYRARPRTKN